MKFKNNEENPIGTGVKIKWFKKSELKELQEAIESKKFKIKKQVDISKMPIIRIDHVTIRILENDVHYEIQDNTNNNYMAEWRKSSGGFIRKDIRKNRIINNGLDYGYYSEIAYESKEKFLKKALVRFFPELYTDMSEEDRKKFLEEQSFNIHGYLEGAPFSIIKIVGINEDYSKPEILTRSEDNLEDLATTDFEDFEESDEDIETQTSLF